MLKAHLDKGDILEICDILDTFTISAFKPGNTMNAMIKMHAHSVAFRSVRATRPPFPPTNRSIRLNCPVPVVKASTNEIPKAKVEPFRMISVSEHVRSREATCFGNFSNGLLQTAVHPVQAIILEALRLEIQKAAVRAFGPGAEALVDGSMAKQTQWRESDVDIIVKTDYPVSRSQRERLVEELKLRPLLHPDHVELGCLAIHIKASYDIDVVCTNTEEFGLRPAAEERLKDNPVASGTARCDCGTPNHSCYRLLISRPWIMVIMAI